MTLTERIQLIRAGYSKKEIQEIIDAEAKPAEPEPAPASPAQVQEPKPVPDPKPAPEQKPVENPVETVDNSTGNAEILTAIKDLTAAIQASNIKKDQIPDNKMTGEDVLTKLVRGKE